MTLDPTDVDAALNDRANWPLAAKCAALRSSGDKTRRANIAILIAAIRKRDARIAELEAENERLRDIISRPFEPQSVSVPSDVVVATPLAPPVNKIATFPRNSPANGVDEQ